MLSLVAGVPISALCLWFAFKDATLVEVGKSIGRVSAGWIIGSILFDLASLTIRAVRWRILLNPVKPLTIPPLLSNVFIGLMLNNLLPARLGEMGRAWALARRERLSGAEIFGTIVIERLLDVMGILLVLGAALGIASGLAPQATAILHRSGIVVLTLALLVITGLLMLLPRRKAVQHWLLDRLRNNPHPWVQLIRNGSARFIQGLYCIPTIRALLAALMLSVLVWAGTISSYFVLAMGFGLGLSFFQTALLFAIVMLGIAIPSAPGSIGTFHGFCVAALTFIAGTEPVLAAAYATVLHGMQWTLNTVVGSACLMGDRSLSWPTISEAWAKR